MSEPQPPPIALKYFFSLRPRVDPSPVGDVPGGFRVDLLYTDDDFSVRTRADRYQADWLSDAPIVKSVEAALEYATRPGEGARPTLYGAIRDARQKTDATAENPLFPLRRDPSLHRLDWFGMDGQIASGADWVTVREDGVAIFDGRVTLKADRSYLIDAVLSGVVDIRDPRTAPMAAPEERRNPVYDRWLLGTLPQDPFPVVLPVRFEAAKTAGNWAREELLKGSQGYWKFERLVRGQFLAVGTVRLQAARYSPISEVQLDVYEIRANPLAAGVTGGP